MIPDASAKRLTFFFRRRTGNWRLGLLCVWLAFSAHAQYGMSHYGRSQGGQVMSDGSAASIAEREANTRQSQAAFAQAAAQQAALQRIYARDPWRRINGVTNRAGGPGWVQFQGKVQEKSAAGVVLKGKWGGIGAINTRGTNAVAVANPNPAPVYGEDIFLVQNFPYAAPSQQGFEEMLAFDSGNFTYTNSARQVAVIHKLDYGTPCRKILSLEELAAQREQAEAPKQAAADKALKFNQAQADKGDAYGLLRMGERYLNGEGVPKDLDKAREYLTKAAQAGSAEAGAKLKEVNAAAEGH
jgi:TPR repeat protein